MSIDNFIEEQGGEQAYAPANMAFWVLSILTAMAFIGPDTDADVERVTALVHRYCVSEHSQISGAQIDAVRRELQKAKPHSWRDNTPLGRKYRVLNAIASSREVNLSDMYNWRYGLMTAFQTINLHHDHDQTLINFVRARAREHGVDLHEKPA